MLYQKKNMCFTMNLVMFMSLFWHYIVYGRDAGYESLQHVLAFSDLTLRMNKLRRFLILAFIITGARGISRHTNYILEDTPIGRQISSRRRENDRNRYYNLSSLIRSFDLIIFGRNNLFGCDRFITNPTGCWGMAILVSSYSPAQYCLF